MASLPLRIHRKDRWRDPQTNPPPRPGPPVRNRTTFSNPVFYRSINLYLYIYTSLSIYI